MVMPCSESCIYCPGCLVTFALSQALGGSTLLICESCIKEWSLDNIAKYSGATDEELDKICTKLTENLKLQDGMVECPGCHVFCKRGEGDHSACMKCENCSKKKSTNCWFCWHCRRPWQGSRSSKQCGNEGCTGEGKPLVVGAKINKGAYGVVFRADKDGKKVVAKAVHKVLVEAARNRRVTYSRLLQIFKAEAFLMKSISHPNIVACYGVEEVGEELYLVMEEMKESLYEYVERGSHGQKECLSTISVGRQIAAALEYLHNREEKVVHRDLSSKNVLISAEDVIKIADFGMAKCRPTDLEYLNTKSPGCMDYMPPEALSDEPKYTEKLDVFSLGVILLEVETFQHPKPGMVGIGMKAETERRKKHLKLVEDVKPIKAIIVSCLQNDHHHRPTSREIKERLKKL